MSTCKSCGAEIIWAITDKRRAMPVDAEPHQDGDCAVEIREIVEGIKAEAVAQAKKEILEELRDELEPGVWFGGSE